MPRYGVPGGVSLLAHFLFVYVLRAECGQIENITYYCNK